MMTSQNPFEKLQEDSAEAHFAQKGESNNESRLQPQWLQSPNHSRKGNYSLSKNAAEENDEDDNWSISTNKNVKRSNITKYNRKQMLNLWKDSPLPAELANFPTITVQKCLAPVAMMPSDSQEEDPNKSYKSRFLPSRNNQPRGRSQPFTTGRNRGRGGRSDGQRIWSSQERERDFTRNSSSFSRSQDLEQNKRSGFPDSDAESTRWFYKDPQGEVQGPFTDLEMNEWYEAGYFSDSLLVKQMHDVEFVELRALFKKDGTSPFIASPDKEINEDISHTENPEHLLISDKFGISREVSNNAVQSDKFWSSNKPPEAWNRDSSERDLWQTPSGPSYVQKPSTSENGLKRKEGVFLLDQSGTTIPATNNIINTLASQPVMNPINSYPPNVMPMYVDPWQQRPHPSLNLQHPPSVQSFTSHPIPSRIDPQTETSVRMQEKLVPDIWTNTEHLVGSRVWNQVEQQQFMAAAPPFVQSNAVPAFALSSSVPSAVQPTVQTIPDETILQPEKKFPQAEQIQPSPVVELPEKQAPSTENKTKSQKKKEKLQKQKKQNESGQNTSTNTKNQATPAPAPWVPPPAEPRAKLSLKDIQEEELRNKKTTPQTNETVEALDSVQKNSVGLTATSVISKQEQKKEQSNPPAWSVSGLPKSAARSFKEIQEAEVQEKQQITEEKKKDAPAVSPQPKKPIPVATIPANNPPPQKVTPVINPEEFPSLPSQPKQPKAPVTKPNTLVPNSSHTVTTNNTQNQTQTTTQSTKQTKQKKKGLVKVDPSMLSFSVTNSSRVMGEIESVDD